MWLFESIAEIALNIFDKRTMNVTMLSEHLLVCCISAEYRDAGIDVDLMKSTPAKKERSNPAALCLR
jgi:hypothetical protein